MRESDLDLTPGRPVLMGILNATPDSFSDRQGPKDLAGLLERGRQLVAEGASIVDVGGESGRTDRRAISEREEAARVVPVVQALVAEGIAVSVDTWRAGPAEAALRAGAAMVNDVSGLSDPAIASLCATSGAALVITHTRVAPKTKAYPATADIAADVRALLAERIAIATERGVAAQQLILDPGLDLGKRVADSVDLLRRLPELAELGRPLLLAISRKDFVGAITSRAPAERDPGTLGAVEPALDLTAGALLRVHDVAGTRDFLAVRRALRGDPDERLDAALLDPALRRERA